MDTNTNALRVVLAIAIIGALNWGLIGFFNWNRVDAIFGGGSVEETSAWSRVIYAIVGVAGLASIAFLIPSRERDRAAMAPGRRTEVRP